MKKGFLILSMLAVQAAPASAFFGGSVVGGVRYAADKAHQRFIELKWVQQIMLMKQNIDATQRYHREFQRLNRGKGFFHNVGDQIWQGIEQVGLEHRARLDYEFIHTYNTNTRVDKLFRGVNAQIEGSMKRAADGMLDAKKGREIGVGIAKDAKGLSPKDAANLSAKAGGIQVQMLQRIYETQLEQLELQAKFMGLQIKEMERRHAMNLEIQKGIKKRFPKAKIDEALDRMDREARLEAQARARTFK